MTLDEDVITCPRCGETKPAGGFSWRRRKLGQRAVYCRQCMAEYNRAHYVANRQRYIDNALRRKRAIRAERNDYLIDFLNLHPCSDCGETDPRVLEFDHRADKVFNVSRGLLDRSWPQVLAELEKCDVRCTNCHRQKTAETFGFARARIVGDRTHVAPTE